MYRTGKPPTWYCETEEELEAAHRLAKSGDQFHFRGDSAVFAAFYRRTFAPPVTVWDDFAVEP